MSTDVSKKLDYLVKACVAIVILSALAFERLGPLRWIAGAFAISAGAVAAFVYFYRHWFSKEAAAGGHTLSARDDPQSSVYYLATNPYIKLNESVEPTIHVQTYVRTMLLDAYLQAAMRTTKALARPSKKLVMFRPTESRADEIVKIVDRLSESKRGYEFVLEQDGNFVIRPASAHALQKAESLSEETVPDVLSVPDRLSSSAKPH